jgi:hypothetical protein
MSVDLEHFARKGYTLVRGPGEGPLLGLAEIKRWVALFEADRAHGDRTPPPGNAEAAVLEAGGLGAHGNGDAPQQGKAFWGSLGIQSRNQDCLVSMPELDSLVRDPRIVGAVEAVLRGPCCIDDPSLRHMDPVPQGQAEEQQLKNAFHRDTPCAEGRLFRAGFVQVFVCLTDVDVRGHCPRLECREEERSNLLRPSRV